MTKLKDILIIITLLLIIIVLVPTAILVLVSLYNQIGVIAVTLTKMLAIVGSL